MHVVVFLTFGVSLKDWDKSGLLSREILVYKKLHKEENINFTFVTFGDLDDEKYFDEFKIIPYYKHNRKYNSKLFSFFQSIIFSIKLKNLIFKPDLIKTNQLMGSWMAIIFKFISSTPLLTRTGYDLFRFSIHEKKNFFKKIFYYILTQLTLIFSDKYLVSSSTDKNFLKKNFLGTNKISVLPNWVLINNEYGEEDISNRKSETLLSVGRLEKQKNFSKLITSFSKSDFEIDIVGDGSEEKKLKQIADETSCKVNFLGTMNNSLLRTFYSNYLIFISTSNYEGNSKTILEAKANGCIVIAKNNENNKEIIKSNEDGILYDEEDLVELVTNLIHDEKLVNSISKNAFQNVSDNNSIEIVAEKEVKFYKNILGLD